MKRIVSLDGLRSLAILMVLLTHIPMQGRVGSLPIFGNGNMGIGILFLLTGFLMSYLHPQPASVKDFLNKRLSRLLPPFLTMVISLTIIRSFNNNLAVWLQLGLVIGVAMLIRIIRKIYFWKNFALIWLIIQLVTAIGYWIMQAKIDPSIFFQAINPGVRWLMTGLVNATLTLPMGKYIMQLDGVYWSLALEMMFYYLYPTLLVPIFSEVRKTNLKWFNGWLLASVWPFCFGLAILASRILGFKMLNIWFFAYFIAGMSIGYNLEWWQKQIKRLPEIILKPEALIPILGLMIIGLRWLEAKLPVFFSPWAQLIWVVPMGGLVLVTTLGKQSWGKWLETKPLIVLSRYSYSLFLVHALVIEWAGKMTVPGSWLYFCFSMVGSIGLAMILYFLTEREYWLQSKSQGETVVKRYYGRVIWVILATIIGVYWAFSPKLAMFSSAYRQERAQFNFLNSEKIRKITSNPKQFRFVARENNLGMITTHLRAIANKDVHTADQESSKLFMSLWDENQQLIAETGYKISEIYEDNWHPFGIPTQANSEGKEYVLEYRLAESDLSRGIEVVNNEEEFITVYFKDKKQLMENPGELAIWLKRKIIMPLTTPMCWLGLIYLGPTLGLLLLQSGIIKYSRG